MSAIPKDLIEFVERERPEVLPGRRLFVDSSRILLEGVGPWNTEHITDDHAAALLVNWLEDYIKVSCSISYTSKFYRELKAWIIVVDGVNMGESEDKLSALWQAYKAVKGMSNGR